MLLIAAVDVSANPLLNGLTVAEAQRAGFWRILAVDLREPSVRTPDLARPAGAGPGCSGTRRRTAAWPTATWSSSRPPARASAR